MIKSYLNFYRHKQKVSDDLEEEIPDCKVLSSKVGNGNDVSFYIPHFTYGEGEVTVTNMEEGVINNEQDDNEEEDNFHIPCSQNIHIPQYEGQNREKKQDNSDDSSHDDKSVKKR